MNKMQENIAQNVAWSLPKHFLYWCVVRAATLVEPDEYPGDVTALEMMDYLKNETE